MPGQTLHHVAPATVSRGHSGGLTSWLGGTAPGETEGNYRSRQGGACEPTFDGSTTPRCQPGLVIVVTGAEPPGAPTTITTTGPLSGRQLVAPGRVTPPPLAAARGPAREQSPPPQLSRFSRARRASPPGVNGRPPLPRARSHRGAQRAGHGGGGNSGVPLSPRSPRGRHPANAPAGRGRYVVPTHDRLTQSASPRNFQGRP